MIGERYRKGSCEEEETEAKRETKRGWASDGGKVRTPYLLVSRTGPFPVWRPWSVHSSLRSHLRQGFCFFLSTMGSTHP